MIDPLDDFDWKSLHASYDACCRGFDPMSRYLARFALDRPTTDRALYYRLVQTYSPDARLHEADPLGAFTAMLYWKLYSQHTSPSMFRKWSAEGGGFDRAAEQLTRLTAELPTELDRDEDDVVTLVQRLGDYALPGMRSPATIPVRSTFLHFFYPTVVPIFDRMVLRAVGETGPNANKSYDVFRQYLSFAWRSADKYAASHEAHPFESPLRRLDMALWVSRGVSETSLL